MKAYQIVIGNFSNDSWKSIFDNFILNNISETYIISKKDHFRVNNYDEIKNNIDYKPYIIGGFISDNTPYNFNEIYYDYNNDIEIYSKKLNYIHNILEWLIIKQFYTYQEECFTFSTINKKIYELFKHYLNIYSKHSIIHDYGYHEIILENLCFINFYDNTIEGKVAFDIATTENKPPYIIFRRYIDNLSFKEYNNNDYLSNKDNIQLISKVNSDFNENCKLITMIYSISNYDSFQDFYYQICSNDYVIQTILSGATDIDIVINLIKEQNNSFQDFILFSNWVYQTVYGADSNEYHSIFYSKNFNLTQKVYEKINKYNLKYDIVDIINRF